MGTEQNITGKNGVVAVVGLGIMGGAFIRLLNKAGWNTIGFDVSEAARDALSADGASIVDDIKAIAQKAEIILTSLPSVSAATDVIVQIAAHAPSSRIIAEMSTFALRDKIALQRLADESGHLLLDCPVSGTGAQAQSGDIAVYASGDSDTVTRVTPLFEDIAKCSINLGAFGQGTKMKLVANLLVAVHNVAAAEAMALGKAAGIGSDAILKAIEAGAGNSRIFELRAPMMAARDYAKATMKLNVWSKDMAAIADFAKELGCATPLLDASAPLYHDAEAAAPNDDTAAVYESLLKLSQV